MSVNFEVITSNGNVACWLQKSMLGFYSCFIYLFGVLQCRILIICYALFLLTFLNICFDMAYIICAKQEQVKVRLLCPVQQPGSYWDRSSALPFVGVEPAKG